VKRNDGTNQRRSRTCNTSAPSESGWAIAKQADEAAKKKKGQRRIRTGDTMSETIQRASGKGAGRMVQRVATLMGCGRERCSLRGREDRGKCQNGRSRAGEESISSSLSERPRRTPNPQATGIWQLSSRSCLAEQPRNDTGVGRQGRWGWDPLGPTEGPLSSVACSWLEICDQLTPP
jgi:hypothetical protein